MPCRRSSAALSRTCSRTSGGHATERWPAPRRGARRTAPRLPPRLADGLPEGWPTWDAEARLPPHRGAQHGQRENVSERVAMKVTGHKTRAVFDRYHIVRPADLQDVARRMTGAVTGTFSGTSAPDRALRG